MGQPMTAGEILNINPLVVWAAAISTLLGVGTTIYNLMTAGARKNDTRIADLTCKVDDTEKALTVKLTEGERRMQRIEDRLTTVPTAEMMHRLELNHATMMGELGMMSERLKPVAAIAERMQEVLMNNARPV